MQYQEGGEVMASIFEIDRQLEELIDPETGELLDYDAFLELQMERDSKIDNTACWVKELTAQANAIDAEIKSLTERKKSAQAKAQRLTPTASTPPMTFTPWQKTVTPTTKAQASILF